MANRLREIEAAIRSNLEENLYHFDIKKPHIPLMVPSYNHEEVLEALESMITTKVTMGEKVFKFEDQFASYIGCKHGIMVNSGSSANLIAVSALCNPVLKSPIGPKFEAVVPAVSWSTTMFPINNCNGTPVICDVDRSTFDLTPKSAGKGVSKKTKIIMPVHLLGNPCEVSQIRDSVGDESIRIVEDSCEAHGAELAGRKVGSLGDLGTFSFFFSHHISTIEGGMVVTNNEQLAESARMLRAHGWVRELDGKREYIEKNRRIDPRFLFVGPGYNLRPTEIQAAFGLHQIRKLEGFIELRRTNASYVSRHLRHYAEYFEIQTERTGTRHVWFGYPITVRENAPFTRDKLTSFLKAKGIETRPIMSGNLAEQPATKLLHHRIAGELPNARRISERSFFFVLHQGLNKEALDYILSCFDDFIKKNVKVR